jgi:putative pyoverdin transport system ATP-binding/permease protein
MEITNSGLYQLFAKEDKSTWVTALVAAILAGLFQGLIVLLINQLAENLSDGWLHIRYLPLLTLALIAFALLTYYSTTKTVALAEQAMFSKYLPIGDSLRRASTIGFENIEKAHICSTLQTNIDIVIETSKTLSSIVAASVMIIFCGVYIAYISKAAILIVSSFYLFGIFLYATNNKNGGDIMRKGAALNNFKELKVNSTKGDDPYDNYMVMGAEAASAARVETEDRLATNSAFVQSFYYAMVAAILVILPQIGPISIQDIIKILALVLFSYGSVTRIVMSIPLIIKAETAINRLSELENGLLKIEEGDVPYNENMLVMDLQWLNGCARPSSG